MCCRQEYSGLDFVVGDVVGGSGRCRSCEVVSATLGKDWRWRCGGDYGFVVMGSDAHCGWKSIGGGKGKVGIDRQVVEERRRFCANSKCTNIQQCLVIWLYPVSD